MKRSPLGPGAKSLARGSTFARPRSELQRTKPLERRTELAQVSPRKTTSAARRRRPISEASPAQRAKVREGRCIITDQAADEARLDPAHLWPRSKGGCDDPLCVVPLRRDLHELYDAGKLSLLEWLITRGCWAELGHIVTAHQVDPISLLQQVTCGTVEIVGSPTLALPSEW